MKVGSVMGGKGTHARDVIELRVHGVGGATPEGLLGEASAEETIRTAGDDLAGFHARKRDLHVEGYVWGRLTSGLLVQPLWIMLLPFTLLNVGGCDAVQTGEIDRWNVQYPPCAPPHPSKSLHEADILK